MKCPHCELPNEDGVALCYGCGMPLTVYGRQITGEVSEATRAKARKLAIWPTVVPAMATYCILAALFGPFWSLVSRFSNRTQVNSEGTNYLGAAFGAVGVTFAAMVLIPMGIALLVIAWGILTQRTWAWWAAVIALGATCFAALTGYFFGAGLFKLIVVAASIALAALWFRSDAREWYGA